MKRASEDLPQRKRLASLFTPAPFPNVNEKPLFETDFSSYARTHPSDIVITNGKIEFESHKSILQACSPFFAALFQSDASAQEVMLNDISNCVLEQFYRLLYDIPEERKDLKRPNQLSASFLVSCIFFWCEVWLQSYASVA